MLPKKDNKTGLVIIIRDLEISEKTGAMSEQGICLVEIEFAKKVDSSLYSVGIFDANIIKGGMDVTSSHKKRIVRGLSECIKKLDLTRWEELEDILITDPNHRYKYDYKNIPPKGSYLSFQQMARGTPTDTSDIRIKKVNESKKNPAYNMKIKGVDNPKDIRFVSDGLNVYIRANEYQYVKSRFYGKYIYFRGRFTTMSSNNSSYFYFGLIGGVIGGGIGGAATSSNSLKSMILNTETGDIKIVNDFNIYSLIKPYPELVKEYRKSKRKLEDKENMIMKINAKYN